MAATAHDHDDEEQACLTELAENSIADAVESSSSVAEVSQLIACSESGVYAKEVKPEVAEVVEFVLHAAKVRLAALLLMLASSVMPLQLLVSSGSGSLQQAFDVRHHGILGLPACSMIVGLSAALAPNSAICILNYASTCPDSIHKVVRIMLVCILFMAVGPLLTILNKNLMQTGFAYPLTLSSQGLVLATIMTQVAAWSGFFSLREETRDYLQAKGLLRVALPIGIAKALTLACGNAVYLHLGLGFIQMLKAFCPAIVVIVMRVLKVQSPSRIGVWFISVIVGGSLLLVRGETHLSLFGIGLMITSETMEAFNLVLTQKLLQNLKFTTLESLYILAPPGAACLLFLAAFLEWPRMVRSGDCAMVAHQPWSFLMAALLGLLVNFVGISVVQATSAVTYKVLNVVRCIGLVFVGVLFYGEVVSVQEAVGYSVSLLGFFGYNWAKLDPEGSQRLEEHVIVMCSRCLCQRSPGERTTPEEVDLDKSCAC